MVPSQEYSENERVVPEVQERRLLDRPIEVELLPATEEDEDLDALLSPKHGTEEFEDLDFQLSPNVSDLGGDSEGEDEPRQESVTGMKRHLDASVDEFDGIEIDMLQNTARLDRFTPPATPPKRPRLDETFEHEHIHPSKQLVAHGSIRLQKRGSEELDEDSSAQDSDLTLRGSSKSHRKKAKTDSSSGTSPSPRPPLTSSESESTSDEGEVVVRGEISLDDASLLVMDDTGSLDVDVMDVSSNR